MRRSSPKRLSLYSWLGLAILLLAAFAIRLYKLDSVPLRGDEAYSVMHWTATPFSERWQQLLQHEPAPVGAFTLFWSWNGLVGTSEFATRYLSLLGNVLGMAVTMMVTRRLLRSWQLALLVGVLWVVQPFLIWHAQDARVYGVLSALTPLTFYWLLRAVGSHVEKESESLRRGADTGAPAGRGVKHWRPYIFVQTLAIYLYYFEPFWMVAQLLYVVALRRKTVFKQAVVAWIIIAILSIPVIAQLYTLMFVSQYEGNAASADFSMLFTTFVPTLLFGFNTISVWLGVLFVVGLVAGLLWVNRKLPDNAGLLLLFWVIIPPLILYGVSFISSFFRPRYVTTVIPGLLIAIVGITAALTDTLTKSSHRRGASVYAPAILVLLLTITSLIEVNDYFHHDEPKATDLPGLMRYIEEHSTPRDIVIVAAIDPALEYYYRGQGDLYILPIDWQASSGEIEEWLVDYESVLMVSGTGTAEIGQMLQNQAQHIPGDDWPGLVRYRHWVVDEAEIQTPLEVNFDDVATLRGYTVIGDSIILLYWEAETVTEAEHSVLLHLESAPGQPVISLDHAISGAIISSRTWTPGVIYRDPVALPIELPAGDYTIYAGFKDGHGDLLPVNGSVDGRYPIGVLSVNE